MRGFPPTRRATLLVELRSRVQNPRSQTLQCSGTGPRYDRAAGRGCVPAASGTRGTPVCPVVLSCRAQDEGQACPQTPRHGSRALSSGVSSAHRLRARRTKGTGHAPRGRQNNKEGDKSLSNGFSLRNTNVSEPGSPPAQLLGSASSSSDRPQLCSHPGRGDRRPSPPIPSATPLPCPNLNTHCRRCSQGCRSRDRSGATEGGTW